MGVCDAQLHPVIVDGFDGVMNSKGESTPSREFIPFLLFPIHEVIL